MNFYLITVFISIILFIALVILSLYTAFILFGCKFFKISPTITSNPKSIQQIIKYLKEYVEKTPKQKIRILDIGSGYGTMLFKISKALSNCDKEIEFVGCEIQKTPYKISNFCNKSENIKFVNDDIKNLNNFDFDIVLSFMISKQQKQLISYYKNLPVSTIIIANSIPIPFENSDLFKLRKKINVDYRWNIFIYSA